MRAEAMQFAKERLQSEGFKLTGPRLKILEYLIDASEHPGVNEIYTAVKKQLPGVGTATIYRTVELLTRLGVIRALLFNGARVRYELNRPRDHHHHLICTVCGQVIDFGSCSFQEISAEIEKVTRFSIQEHILQAYGHCPKCIPGS